MNHSSAIVEALGEVELGTSQTFQNMTVFPLHARSPREAGYVTLDDALGKGWVHISEVGDAGTVPELSLLNGGPSRVLLLDGEELVGAKQNRVLNLTMLVPANSKLVIPVSCVEAGRWNRVSRHFSSAPRAHFAEGRAAKMRHVTESMRYSGTRRSNQSEVWRAIDEKASRLGAQSGTHAMAAMFEKLETNVDDFVEAFPPAGAQVGAIVAINGRIAGLEQFDASSTWRKLAPKLIRSYAIDAIDRTGGPGKPTPDEAKRFMSAVAASPASEFAASGIGSDVRISSGAIAAAALVVDGRVVHLSAFGG